MKSLIRLVYSFPPCPRCFALVLALLVLACAAAPATAAVIYWTGGGANSNWSDSANWSGSAPGSSDEAVFYQNALRLDNTSNTTRTINKLTFDTNATSPVNINIASTSPLTLGSGGISVLAGSHTITGTDPPGSGYHLRLPNSTTPLQINVAEDAELTLAARLGDDSSNPRKTITKAGAGTLVLNYNQGGSGVVKPIWNIEGGVLRITTDGALGWSQNPVHVRNVARIELDGGGMGNSNSTTTLYGALTAADDTQYTRLVNVSGVNTVSSDILLQTDGSHYGIQSDAGTMRITGEIRRGNATGTRHLYLRGEGDGIVLGSINGSGFNLQLIKQGAGTWTLAGNNTYTHSTVIEGGTLRIGDGGTSGTLGSHTDTFVAGGAVLEINRTDQFGYQYGGTLSGSGTVVIPADGRRFDFDVAQPDSGDLSFVVDGRLAARAIGQEIHLGELSGSGSLSTGGSTPVHPIVVVGGKNTDSTFSGTVESTVILRKVGDGTLTLTGANSYTGGTTIEAGTLLVNNTAGSGTGSGNVAVTGGTLGGIGTIGGDTTIGAFGTLSPGESIGMLTFAPGAGLTLDAGAAIHWQFDQAGTAGIDYDSITGDALYLPQAGPIELNIFGPGANVTLGDTFTLFAGDVFDHNATLFAPGHDLSGLFNITDHSGWWGTWEVSAGSLVLTAVPEPGSAALLAFGLLAWLLVRRRRR